MKQEEIDKLNKQARMLENQASELRGRVELEKLTNIKKDKTMGEWVDYSFESSTGLTEEFALFAKQFKTALLKQVGVEVTFTLVAFSKIVPIAS